MIDVGYFWLGIDWKEVHRRNKANAKVYSHKTMEFKEQGHRVVDVQVKPNTYKITYEK